MKIIFIDFEGSRHVVEAPLGISVMEAARLGGISGIEAECGGECACATCHVVVLPKWLQATGVAGEDESDLLEFVDDREEGSRLSCQIKISAGMEGLEVRIPENQGF